MSKQFDRITPVSDRHFTGGYSKVTAAYKWGISWGKIDFRKGYQSIALMHSSGEPINLDAWRGYWNGYGKTPF